MQTGNFHGLKTVVLENKFFRIECLAEAGPRIVRLVPQWLGENLFAETPEFTARVPSGEYHYYGGHRLWIAPEKVSRSYIPDDAGATVTAVSGGYCLAGAVEAGTGLRKTITVQVSAAEPYVIVRHKIENLGSSVMKLSPWAITMLQPSGVAILPQQTANMDEDGYQPNRRFALWPYSRWNDARLRLGDEFVTITADATPSPFKLGYFNTHGWLGYVRDEAMFVKRFGVRRDQDYPDFGCNSEVYVDARSLELETLAAVQELGPKMDIVHTETWEVHRVNNVPKNLLGGRTIASILEE
ncbi:MAG: hypothetical protein IT313_07625 [Anaerolineales bacterium]|nr:hypothetical protein [Anaerolineales bacterium]